MIQLISVCFVLPDLGGGGAQRVMLELARALDPRRFAVTVVVVGGSQLLADQVPADLQVIQLGAQRLRQGLPRLVRCLRQLQPAIVVSVMGYLNLALLALRSLLKGRPRIVVREANMLSATVAELPWWFGAHQLYRVLYPKADAIIVPVGAIAHEIAKIAPGAQAQTVVIPNPVNEAALRGRATPPQRPTGTGLLLVGAGRLTAQKGFDRLIDLMPQLPTDTRLVIFGDGPDRRDLERLVGQHKLGDRVTLAPFSTSLPAAIAGADVFVLPSRWEGLPNVVLEALALGVPVVASDEANVHEIAAKASPGAVVVTPTGARFVDAIRGRAPLSSPPAAPRPSLLPADYRHDAVVATFSQLLGRIAA